MKNPLIVILFSLFVISCADQVAFEEIDAEQKFVLRCEIQPGHEPVATLQLTSLFDGSLTGGMLPDAEIFLRDGTDARLRLAYKEELGKYVGDFIKIDPAKQYKIVCSHPEHPDLYTESNTSIPRKMQLDSVSVESLGISNNKESLKLRIRLPEVNGSKGFFHIIPSRRRAIQENEGLRYLGLEEVRIDRIYNDNFIVQELFHKGGVLVDHSRYEDDFIEIDVHSLPLEANEVTPAVYFEVLNVTEDYYHFHISRSNQLRDSRDFSGTPAINYTNMTDGYGLFAGKSSTIDSVAIIIK